MENFRDLIVWQKAVDLVLEIYRATNNFPRQEQYVLTAQIRRAVISIPGNIAEGRGRFSRADFLHFLMQARGSLFELETQLLIAQRLGYLSEQEHASVLSRCAEVAKLFKRHGARVSRQSRLISIRTC